MDGWFADPTLKRGANLHRTYGASRMAAVGTEYSVWASNSFQAELADHAIQVAG
jgi:hypothetical protein